ncbi:hypothetical protein ACSFA3_10040 [Variovorax sp. RHLX14]|uniref:hypothetical protein n=1 Tax=Variovorax sp. RHLX14 TaxID=1259731 RepID=UPI003F469F61
METQHLDDEELAATAYIWREKGKLGDRHASRVADELDAELHRRLGPTPSRRMELGRDGPAPGRPWWKFW